MAKKVYSWEEIEKHAVEESAWLAIRGKVYDVTSFLPRHPGGEMLLIAAGRDSTQLFESHHPLSVIDNEEMLAKFYIGDAEPTNKTFPPRSKFYTTLKQRVEAYFSENKIPFRDSPVMYAKSVLSMLFFFLAYYCSFFAFKSLFMSCLFAVVFGYSIANIGMGIMHDGNHGGYSNNPLVNKIMGMSFDLIGGSGFVWKMIHGVGHHTWTNIDELDPDIHTNEPVHFRRIKKTQSNYNFYKYQHLYLPFLYMVLVPELLVRDIVALVKQTWNGVKFQPVPTSEYVIFAISKIWYFAFNFLLPLHYGIPLWRVILLYAISAATTSELLVLVFQVNHVTDKSTFYNTDKSGNPTEDWAIIQATGSTNFSVRSVLWNHLSGGLNHQIEHHLFPSISHVHYPALSPIVEKTCKEFKLPYNHYSSFWTAILGHFNHLKNMAAQGVPVKRPHIE